MKLSRFALATLIILGLRSHVQAGMMTEPPAQTIPGALKLDFKHYEKLTETIQTFYEGENVLFVGIGRSPTPVVAMMKAKFGESAAINLPLSGLTHFSENLDADSRPFGAVDWVSEDKMRERFTQILDAYISSLNQNSRRKIVFMDYANTGKSLLNFQREFARWNDLRPSGERFDFEMLGFVHPDLKGIAKSLERAGIKALITNRKLGINFNDRVYRKMAEYDSDRLQSPRFEMPTRETIELKRSRFMENFQNSWARLPSKNEPWALERQAYEMRNYEMIASFELLVEAYRNKLESESNPAKSRNIFARWLSHLKELSLKFIPKNQRALTCNGQF